MTDPRASHNWPGAIPIPLQNNPNTDDLFFSDLM